MVEKLSILLIRTDRGIYKRKNIERRNNIIAKSTTLSAMQKFRKSSAIVPSINLSYLNKNQADNPTQRHLMKTLGDDFGPGCVDDDVCAQSDAMTDMVNIRGGGQDGYGFYGDAHS